MIPFFEDIVATYQDYLLLVIIVFGVIHPLTENPWSFFTLGLAIPVLGFPMAVVAILLSNTVGILLLYALMHSLHNLSDYKLQHKPTTAKALNWLAKTPMYKHIIVIGLPSVPTYPIKVALPLSKISFLHYLITLLGSYIFLISANSLLYYGVFGFFSSNLPNWVSILFLVLFATLVYTSGDIRRYFNKSNTNIEVKR